jgi:hypothetical protein
VTDPPLVPVSGLVEPGHRDLIVALGGEQGVSAGLRLIVAAGAAATRSPSSPVLQELDALRGLADRLAGVLGRQTPSGAWWAPSDDAMPPPELLADTGDVVASPERVVLAGAPAAGVVGALALDLTAWRLELQEGERVASVAMELGQFAPLATMFGPALVQLAASGPSVVELTLGVSLRRQASGMVRAELNGVGAVVSATAALSFAAEAVSLLARHVEASANARAALEASLAATGGEVAP